MSEDKMSALAELVNGFLHPSPGLCLILLAVILTGRSSEAALAVVLILSMNQ